MPAFAILLQMVVESDMAYTHLAVPITTAGMGRFLLAGVLFATTSAVATAAPGGVLLGMLSLILGGILLGLQTVEKQRYIRDDDS